MTEWVPYHTLNLTFINHFSFCFTLCLCLLCASFSILKSLVECLLCLLGLGGQEPVKLVVNPNLWSLANPSIFWNFKIFVHVNCVFVYTPTSSKSGYGFLAFVQSEISYNTVCRVGIDMVIQVEIFLSIDWHVKLLIRRNAISFPPLFL